MKNVIIKVSSTLFTVIVFSEIWWNLVMYKGFPIKPPEFVRTLVTCDGEASCDLMIHDMQLTLIFGVLLVFSVFKYVKKNKEQSKKSNLL